MSIIFVNSQGVFYPEPSEDPIFPATKVIDLGIDNGIRYIRPSAADSILACVDTNLWRIPVLSDQWYDQTGRNQDGTYFNLDWLRSSTTQTRGALRLLVRSLRFSRIAISLRSRQGMGLAATKLLEAGYSFKIAKEQWKEEAKRLFEASLARIQTDIRDISLGTPKRYGAERIERGQEEICDRTVLFRSQGWQNVHVAGSVWILFWSLVVVLMAVPLDDDRLLAEHVWRFMCLFYDFCRGRVQIFDPALILDFARLWFSRTAIVFRR